MYSNVFLIGSLLFYTGYDEGNFWQHHFQPILKKRAYSAIVRVGAHKLAWIMRRVSVFVNTLSVQTSGNILSAKR